MTRHSDSPHEAPGFASKSTRETVVRLEGITRVYGQTVKTHALRGIDLRINAGEQVALIGPSGSGKTTLLNIIGLLDRPSAGRLRLAGDDIASLDDAALTRLRGQHLGFVFQHHHLLAAFTAEENVALPLAAQAGRSSEAQLARARKLLREVGLSDRATHLADALSGGQKQRVAIARALILDPALLLADEPTGNLDTESSAQVFALLDRLNREHQLTELIVTHDPRIAARCERTIEIVDGQIVRDERRSA